MSVPPNVPLNVPPIAPFDGIIEPDTLAGPREAAPAASKFAEWFSRELSAVNDKLVTADHDRQKLAVGMAENLHEVMIHMEEARLSFLLLSQVRNKMLEAYQEVMRMQI